jgi:hypothetical protein
MSRAEQKARELISKQTTEELLTQWELTNIMNDEHIPTVRGWLMDELEKRNPEAFEKFLDDYAEDDELRKYMTA